VRKLVITLFCIALLIPSRGNTLGLGEIELHSSLNQELKAEIALLSVGKESAETIIVKLASREDFARAGIDRPFILNDLKFTVKVKNGQPYISVTSKKTIREPFLSFLLDIDWPRGRILREFTMLLDPPVFMQATPEGVPSKAVASPQAASDQVQETNQQYSRPGYEDSASTNSQASADTGIQSGAAAPAANDQMQAQTTTPQTTNQAAAAPTARYQPVMQNAYRVQKNDTAWKIAEKLRTDPSISVEQMMMALLRRNPEAFIRDNINGVKRGYILRMPEQQEITNLSQQTALVQVREQYALWREYRQALTAKRNANKIARDSGKSDVKTDSSVKGQLTIASAAEGTASEGATSGEQNPQAELKQLRQDLASTSEELESGKLENTELKDRIKSLQTRLKKMERLLNLKDGDLANLQSDISPTEKPAETPAADTTAMTPAAVDMKAEEPATEEMAATPEIAASEQTADESAAMGEKPADAAVDTMASAQPAEEAVFTDEMAAAESAPVPPQAVAVPPLEPADVGKVDSLEFIEELLTDPKNLPIIAGVPAIILILILLLIIRRKKAKQAEAPATDLPETGDFNFDEVPDIDLSDDVDDFNEQEEEDLGAQLEAFAEEAEAESSLPDEEDVISLEDGPSEDEIPKDDVMAEADVYLAYGIYPQAEELLKGAIAGNPERDDYKIKLAETYFAAKDQDNFSSHAEVLSSVISPDSEDWQRIIAMGTELVPEHALFRDAGEVKGFDIDDLIPEKPETDFDLGDAAADFDLGESIDESDDFAHGLDDASLDDEPGDDLSGFDLGDADSGDSFALDDDGMDELDKELAAAGVDESESEIELTESQPEEEMEEIDDDFSLDFEMADLGLDESAAEISAEETDVVATSMEPETDISFDLPDDGLDSSDEEVSLDMDLGDMPAELEPEVVDDSADDMSLDMGEIDLGGIDLAADDSEDEVSLDMGDIDLPADMDESASADLDMDLGDIDLSADEDATVVRSTPEEDDEMIDISTLPEDLDEVNTKLDLARAYLDMGDNDGAADILREVIEEGADSQKQTAEELLKNIA